MTDLPLEWANDRAGMGGEEYEHTLYFDEEDVDRLGLMQVWNDFGDDGDDGALPLVGFFARWHADNHEFRYDLSPDQALDLAAMLIVHAQDARDLALDRALDE